MISDIFASVPEHRVAGRCTYSLADLLTIALLTYLCGGVDYVDMSEFARARARGLGLLASVEDGRSPSPDTFERLMSSVAPEHFERCLRDHGRQFLDTLNEKQVVIDGKKLRGTSPRLHGTKGDYLMNAFVSENSLAIEQLRLKDKENEITALPKIIGSLDITGAVVSIDAIGTQVGIAQQIRDQGGHYLLAVKENQPALAEAVEDAYRYNSPLDTCSDLDAGHGRIETRTCRILDADAIEDRDVADRWPGLKTLVEVTSEVDYGDHNATTIRRFISDEDFGNARYFSMLARGHWSVENGLHWMLDVTFHEDACRARKGYAAQNLAVLRKLALQIARSLSDKRSIKKRLFRAALSVDYLLEMLKCAKF